MPAITDFKALTFDCYGTLIDWERGILAELIPWASRHGLTVTPSALLEAFGEIEARCEAETPHNLYPQILETVLARLAVRWTVDNRPGEAQAFAASVGRWPPFSDSSAALQYLQQHYKLVIISNVDRASFSRSQEKLGVAFDAVITAEDVSSYKPSLRHFESALAHLAQTFAIEPRHVLHVAQSLFHDIVPAKSLGLRTMWINRRKGLEGWGATPPPSIPLGEARPDFEVTSLAELAELHESLVRETLR